MDALSTTALFGLLVTLLLGAAAGWLLAGLVARARQAVLANRDIIRLFSGLRESDSFLMKNNDREILFRKPTYDTR